jgi:RNA polymerase sigma-70 factor (ECF subfamily)
MHAAALRRSRLSIAAMTDASSVHDLDAAWARFHEQLQRWLVRRLPQAADAEDVLQQVFMKLAEKPPADVPEERIGAWLFRVARNSLVDARRRAGVRHTDRLEVSQFAEEQQQGVGSLSRCLEPMLRTLPPDQAAAVREADLNRRGQRELADEAGISLSAMKSRVQRGRARLRENLLACCRPDEDLNCSGCEDDAPCQ